MNDHVYNMRLRCQYSGDDNHIEKILAEQRTDNGWRLFDLNLLTPGFSVYVYSLLTCQHTYFRINCAESGLALASSQGSLELAAGEDWMISKLHVNFDGTLRSGAATRELVDQIVGRMSLCPVSRNTRDVGDARTTVRFS